MVLVLTMPSTLSTRWQQSCIGCAAEQAASGVNGGLEWCVHVHWSFWQYVHHCSALCSLSTRGDGSIARRVAKVQFWGDRSMDQFLFCCSGQRLAHVVVAWFAECPLIACGIQRFMQEEAKVFNHSRGCDISITNEDGVQGMWHLRWDEHSHLRFVVIKLESIGSLPPSCLESSPESDWWCNALHCCLRLADGAMHCTAVWTLPRL